MNHLENKPLRKEPNPPVLLLAFNRFELLKSRIEELLSQTEEISELYIVIDGPRNNNKEDVEVQLQIKNYIGQKYNNSKIIHRTKNLGCSANMILSVTEVLNEHSNIIVIEDDVSIDRNFYEVMSRAVKEFLVGGGEIATICGYSPISMNKYINKFLTILPDNSWRSTKYFHCWGWATSRVFWDNFVQIDETIVISNYLNSSKIWRNFSERRKQIWLARLNRRVWDYQVQTNLYKMEKLNLFPYYSLIYNEGQGRIDSTHTKHKKPWYMTRNVNRRSKSMIFKFKPSNFIWNLIDSETLAADGFLNSRGRKFGVRTLFRSLCKKTLGKFKQ